MIKVLAQINNRQTLILGLDRENTTRLHSGKPIAIDIQALAAQHDSVQDVVICAGESLGDIEAELLDLGLVLPPEQTTGYDQ